MELYHELCKFQLVNRSFCIQKCKKSRRARGNGPAKVGEEDLVFERRGRHRPGDLQPAAGAQRLHVRDVRAARRDLRARPTTIERSRCWCCAGPATRRSPPAPTSTSSATSRRRRTRIDYENRIDRVLATLETVPGADHRGDQRRLHRRRRGHRRRLRPPHRHQEARRSAFRSRARSAIACRCRMSAGSPR